MSTVWLFFVAVIFALADWYAVFRNVTWLRYSAKPLVIFALTAWLVLQPVPFTQSIWFFFALLFSLSGDIWLLAPPRYFLAGLASFLFAHVCYVIGINAELPPSIWQVYCLAAVFLGSGSIIFPMLYRGVKNQPGARKLQGAVLIYCIILSLMAFSAMTTLVRPNWNSTAALSVASGGLFFFLSDFLLAYDRFIQSFRHGRLVVHITYHLGQFGLIAGVIGQLLS